MQSTKIKKATFKHIESELYNYEDTKKEIDRLRNEIMLGGSNQDENIGGNRSAEPSRPTERIATRLLTHKTLRNLEEIAEAIEYVYAYLPDDHKNVIKTKYWLRQRLTWDDVAIKISMHRNTAMKLRREFILLVADKIGWR